MTVKFLKKLKEKKPESTLSVMLHQHLTGPQPARPLQKIHASEMTKDGGLCPRLYALADLANVKPGNEFLTTSEQLTFQIGRDVQDNVVNWFADMGMAMCHWRCTHCSKLHEFQLRPLKCDECTGRRFDPEEVRFQSAITGASCGVDMIVAMDGHKLTPVEIKTIAPDQFKTLAAPLAEHRWRTNLYLRIIAESDEPKASLMNTEKARILYVTKGGYGKMTSISSAVTDKFSPFQEFVITRDDEETHEICKRAEVVTRFRNGLVGMPCGVCSSHMDKRAKKCPARKACFSGEFPAEYDWMSE